MVIAIIIIIISVSFALFSFILQKLIQKHM
jgi:hypothetical protein